MYRIFKNAEITDVRQVNEFTVAEEAKKIFQDLKDKSIEDVIGDLKVKVITTYHDGIYVFIDKK